MSECQFTNDSISQLLFIPHPQFSSSNDPFLFNCLLIMGPGHGRLLLCLVCLADGKKWYGLQRLSYYFQIVFNSFYELPSLFQKTYPEDPHLL